MWIVSRLLVHPHAYSFASSGQATHEDLALRADDEQLVNMLRLVDWSEDPVQVVVCDACGTAGCATGNYVAVRRLGDYVALAPPTKAYATSADDYERNHFLEPWFIRKHGVPLVPVAEWERIREEGAPLPSPDTFEALRWDEAVLAAQLEAPHRALGEPGGPGRGRLSEVVVATDPWIDATTLDRLGDPDRWRAAGFTAALGLAEPASRVSLWLVDELRAVVLFARTDDGYGLYVEPGLLLVPVQTPQKAAPGARP